MSSRKNLLEAFSAKRPPEGTSGTGSTPSLPFSGSGSRGGGQRWVLVAFGLCLAFALGFAFGRGGRAETQAKEVPEDEPVSAPQAASQPRNFQERTEKEASPAAPGGASRLEDSALYDPTNQYTVVVEAYSKTAPELAWATHDHLKEEGFDVFPPIASRNLLLILVGAAPRSSDLADVQARLRKLERDGKREYDDAYRQSIDQLISRNFEKD